MRKNKNRGYQQLRVWRDAIDYYVNSCEVFQGLPYELRRIASQQMASCDSIHRNIAEGHCRRSIREYLNFLNIARGSAGESVSGLIACSRAKQITDDEFEALDSLAFKIENGLLKLIESLEQKRSDRDWEENLMVRELNAAYATR